MTHTGLQTVSWLFDGGEIEHRDSAGVQALVRPGEVNLMTSGFGIAHSEVSTPQRDLLHTVQLWVLPESSKDLRAGRGDVVELHRSQPSGHRAAGKGMEGRPEDRFGRVAGYRGVVPRLIAPPLPEDLRLKRRFRRGRQ